MANDIHKMAEEAFKDHQLVGHDAMHAVVRREGSGLYATEIRILSCNRVIVHGDIAPTIFACPYKDIVRVCEWIGESHASYITSKVREGERRHDAGYTIDLDEAKRDLAELREEQEWSSSDLEAIETAIMYVRHGDAEMAQRTIAEGVRDGFEIAPHIGRVVEARVHFAQAAARRACALLTSERNYASRAQQ